MSCQLITTEERLKKGVKISVHCNRHGYLGARSRPDLVDELIYMHQNPIRANFE